MVWIQIRDIGDEAYPSMDTKGKIGRWGTRTEVAKVLYYSKIGKGRKKEKSKGQESV